MSNRSFIVPKEWPLLSHIHIEVHLYNSSPSSFEEEILLKDRCVSPRAMLILCFTTNGWIYQKLSIRKSMLTYFMYLELRRCRFTGWKTRREGEGKRGSRRGILWERDFMREKKKVIYSIEMKDHSVCREEMNRMVYRKKRWTGWWVASPCLHSWWPWPPVSGYRPSGGCSFPGASPGIDSAVTSGHFFFLLPGKYSNVLYRNRVAASFNIHAFEVGLHPLSKSEACHLN